MKLVYPQETLNLSEVAPNDWNLYLEGCLFRMVTPRTNEKFKWGLVESVDIRSHKLYIMEEDGKSRPYGINQVVFDFRFPPSGVYNFKNSTLFLSRLHARQWRKGISSATYQVHDVFRRFYRWPTLNLAMKREFGDDLTKDFAYTPKIASQVFDGVFPKFENAYSSVKKHRALSRAISPDIFLSIGAKDSRPLVWYGTIPVGVAESEESIVVQVPEFEQELLDSFRDLKEKKISVRVGDGKGFDDHEDAE